MIRFKLFGIPVEIQPFFWVTTCLLGGGISAHTREAMLSVVIFMIAALISILVHELGHALTGLRYGGGFARISLTAFGGLAYHEGGILSRDHRFRMVAAGPGAGFALFAAVAGLLCIAFTPRDGLSLVSFLLFGQSFGFSSSAVPEFVLGNPIWFDFVVQMLWINFWWSLINMLPVLPLDGGRIAELFVHPRQRLYQIGIACAAGVAFYGYF
jgi:stage IV sporulation protein FB